MIQNYRTTLIRQLQRIVEPTETKHYYVTTDNTLEISLIIYFYVYIYIYMYIYILNDVMQIV